MSAFKIEKDVPIPPKRSDQKAGRHEYPFREMAVGDSFLVACSKEEQTKVRGRIWSVAQRVLGSPLAGKIAVRAVESGLRVWRLK